MKNLLFALLVICFTVTIIAQQKPALKNQKEKASYALGLNTGRQMQSEAVELDIASFMKGLEDGFLQKNALLTDKELQDVAEKFRTEMTAKYNETLKKNLKEGEAFLAENKKKQGVITLPSGLQYKVIKNGTGKQPKATDTVTVHYRGTLTNGKEFDSSYKRNEPTTFPLNQVIKGWTEGVQLMKVGSKWQFFIPSQLAYGERAMGAEIKPNSTLIFEVELVGIK
ncbi:MAG: FKBP-type peptidyl-prolyl cis-trans isomerase [bacterium]